jgi:Cof subfamily protein (haloacid dehalogenase superfamily)
MLTKKHRGICVTDLDGTLLNLDHQISEPDLQAFRQLGEQNICRVAATGRSLFSLQKVITTETPFDYVIFSTGAGVMNWQTRRIMFSHLLSKAQAESTFRHLIKLGEDFFYHAPIPENHCFVAVQGRGLPDFKRRIGVYQAFEIQWDGRLPLPWQEGTQFLVVTDEYDESLYLKLINLLQPLQVIRTTSPFDHVSLWLEIFAPEVSKGSAVQYLLDVLGLDRDKLMVAGNDFNDWDMLKLTPHAYVTSNAPAELKKLYTVVADHNSHGFAEAVELWLGRENG